MYSQQFINNVNEAYRVLSSTNNIKPEYDKEYALYKATNDRTYNFSNPQIEKDILYIRESMTPQQKSHKRNIHVNNAIFLSILIFIALLLFIGTVYWSNSYSNYYSNIVDYGTVDGGMADDDLANDGMGIIN